MTAYDPAEDPVRQFLAALPPGVRNHIQHTARITVLVHRAVRDHGWTPRQLADRCKGDLGANPGGTVTYRLERDSQAPPPDEDDTRKLPFCTPECRDNAGWILDDDGLPTSRCPCRKAAG